MDETFDVFLSHNNQDKPAVRQIAEALQDRGLRVWLDEWELTPGRRWQDELDIVIRTVRSAAIFVGKDGLGPWEMPDMEAILSEATRRELPVIPVLLPGVSDAPKLPLFLRRFTWLDLREGITAERVDRLMGAITGRKTSRPASRTRLVAPGLHNLPFPSLGELFRGREEELRSLGTEQVTTIYGLGGIGKTRIAVEYAWKSRDLYNPILFVIADSPDTLRTGLADLARSDLLDLPEYGINEEHMLLRTVLRWFRRHDRWLLILDNVDTKEATQAVTEILPALSSGRVLITSRSRQWSSSVRGQSLGALSSRDAKEFLLQRTANDRARSKNDSEQVRFLAKRLGGIPLALELAAAYIAHHRTTFSDYLYAWEIERQQVPTGDDETGAQYPASAAALQAALRALSPPAIALLRLTAYFAPNPILLEIFEKGFPHFDQAVLLLCREIGKSHISTPVKAALAELATYSLVTEDATTFTVHPIIQTMTQSTIPEERHPDWIEQALRIAQTVAGSYNRTGQRGYLIRPHASMLIESAIELASSLLRYSQYEKTESLMRQTLQISEDIWGTESLKTVPLLNKLAQLLQTTGRFEEAELLLRKALKINERSLGPQHPNVAADFNTLAQLLQRRNRSAEAESFMRKALQIREEVLGRQHVDVAVQLSELAQVLASESRPEEAEHLLKRALAIAEASLGGGHAQTASIRLALNNLIALKSPPESLNGEELLLLAFRLVVARRASPDLLLHLDASRLREAAEGVLDEVTQAESSPLSRLRTAADRLVEQFPTALPDPLWLSWMLTTQSKTLEDLAATLASAAPSSLPS